VGDGFLAFSAVELFARRRLWQFEADSVPQALLADLSLRHPRAG
jgi:hypothetical protein